MLCKVEKTLGCLLLLTPAKCTKYIQVKPSWKIFLEKVCKLGLL